MVWIRQQQSRQAFPSQVSHNPSWEEIWPNVIRDPARDLNLNEMVDRVEQRLRQVPLVEETTCQESSSSEEELITLNKRKTLMSDMNHTDATLVKRHINWPHEVLYSADGKPAIYGDLPMVAFVRWW